MDLSVKIGDTRLKIRVAAVVTTPEGFLFEKSDGGYIFAIGGKVQINETSTEAIKREILEEIGMEVQDVKLCCVIETFYSTNIEKVHEICFVYKIDTPFTGSIPDGFLEVLLKDINKHEIKPAPLMHLITDNDYLFKHVILNQNSE